MKLDLSANLKISPERFNFFTSAVAFFAFFLLMAEMSGYFSAFSQAIRILNLTVFSIFTLDVALRFYHSADRGAYFGRHFKELIVLVPLIQIIMGTGEGSINLIVRQVVIVVVLFSRMKKAKDFIVLMSKRPAHLMVASFGFTICAGAILLMLPLATNSGIGTSFVDAIFTATSATCVTGLIVQDTATHFNIFGQSIILILIQIGGLGIMTASVAMVLLLQKKLEKKDQMMMRDVLDEDTVSNVKGMLMFIFKMTLGIEFIGAVILFVSWIGRSGNVLSTAFQAFFHSVSAFCNAGFSTFSNNLADFSNNISTNLVICLLIIAGGLGFTVIKDLESSFFNRNKKNRTPLRLKAQTKIVLSVSLALIVGGALLIYFLERNHTLSGLSAQNKILAAFFQSVTTRTAGFNTVNIGMLAPATSLLFIVLMFIGGSPGSTAGGIKTTTLAVLWSAVASGLRQKPTVELYKRTIPSELIIKATIILLFSLVLVLVFTGALLYTEQKPFKDLFFETVSALGTAGLSTGITGDLSNKGKLMLTLIMFIGRLGPLTIAYAFMAQRRPAQRVYAQERVMVG